MVTYEGSESNAQKGSLGLGSDPNLIGHSTQFPLGFSTDRMRGQGVLHGKVFPDLENEEHILGFFGINPRRESS